MEGESGVREGGRKEGRNEGGSGEGEKRNGGRERGRRKSKPYSSAGAATAQPTILLSPSISRVPAFENVTIPCIASDLSMTMIQAVGNPQPMIVENTVAGITVLVPEGNGFVYTCSVGGSPMLGTAASVFVRGK